MLDFDSKFPFSLPALPYEKSALEPYVSSNTFSFHHEKHHKAYIDNMNNLVVENGLESFNLGELIEKSRSDKVLQGVFNNAAQSWNHAFYWKCMKRGSKKPQDDFMVQIEKSFGGYNDLKSELIKHGLAQFGSGWVWLVWDYSKSKLSIIKTSNADLPNTKELLSILTIDVWEHAYYLDYQNNRKSYLDKFIEFVANWEFAQQNFMNVSN